MEVIILLFIVLGMIVLALLMRKPASRRKKSRGRTAFTHTTTAGLRVRSYAEKVIAEFLDSEGIAYEYERRITLRNHRGNRTWRSCDFTLHRTKGRPLLWEHFGMWDDPDYQRKARQKMAMYHGAGYEFIATFVDAPSMPTMKSKLRPYRHQLRLQQAADLQKT